MIAINLVVSTVGKCLQSPGKQLGYACDPGANNAINVVYIIRVTIITTWQLPSAQLCYESWEPVSASL